VSESVPSVYVKSKAAIVRIAKAAIPAALGLSRTASENWAQHQHRLATVEVAKAAMMAEVALLAQLKQRTMEKFFDAGELDRVRLRQDVQEIEREQRRIGVYLNALNQLAAPKDAQPAPEEIGHVPVPEDDPINPAWIDRFDKLARLQNEDWRADLLAKALAAQAKNPNAISARGLWFVGTMDEQTFHAFASLIDVSSIVGSSPMVPHGLDYLNRVVPGSALGPEVTLAEIAFALGDLGLIGDLSSSFRGFRAGATYAGYGEQRLFLTLPTAGLRAKGLVFTNLGAQIATLYDPKPNELGAEIFNAWLKTLPSDVGLVDLVSGNG
jgi:hypothetical protein